MTYAIEIERSALKEFAAIPKRDRERIYERLQQLSADPFAMAGVKKLSSQPGYGCVSVITGCSIWSMESGSL